MNLKSLVNEAAKFVAAAVEREVANSEERQDFLRALQSDLKKAAEAIDDINFETVESLKRAGARRNPLANGKIDWSVVTDHLREAAEKQQKSEPSVDEMLEWMGKNVQDGWNDPDRNWYWRQPQNEAHLRILYKEWVYRKANENNPW